MNWLFIFLFINGYLVTSSFFLCMGGLFAALGMLFWSILMYLTSSIFCYIAYQVAKNRYQKIQEDSHE